MFPLSRSATDFESGCSREKHNCAKNEPHPAVLKGDPTARPLHSPGKGTTRFGEKGPPPAAKSRYPGGGERGFAPGRFPPGSVPEIAGAKGWTGLRPGQSAPRPRKVNVPGKDLKPG